MTLRWIEGMGSFIVAVLLAAPAAASADRPEEAVEASSQPVAWQLRLGYEASTLSLRDITFSGRADDSHAWTIDYESRGIPATLVAHGVAFAPNVVFRPPSLPFELMAGIHGGLAFASVPFYRTVDGDVSARPDPEQLAVVLRAGAPLGLRFPFGDLALRTHLVPGLTLVTIDEVTQSSEGSASGTSLGLSETFRAQGGIDARLFEGLPLILTVDAGYDFGRLGGWVFGSGIAFETGAESL